MYIESIILNDIIPAQKENTTMLNAPKVAIIDMLNTDYSNADESCYLDALAIARDILIKGLYDDDEVQFMAKQFLGDKEVEPKGYIIRNDGMFGEWNLWLDDTLGTIIGNGYESKDAAIKAAWQHKESNQSKGDVMNNDAIILFLSDAHGQYIPKVFAESIVRGKVIGISEDDYNTLLEGPENELYWDTWDSVLDTAKITDNAGNVFTLYQDGDLFLICDELMTYEQSREFFGTDVYGEDEDASAAFDVPEWIDHDVTLGQMQSISEGGCASGAYMPAVTYHTAKETMTEHGDDVLQYIEDSLGEIPAPNSDESWSGIAVHYLSIAVELWAGQIDTIEVK